MTAQKTPNNCTYAKSKPYKRYVQNSTGDAFNLTYDDGKEVCLGRGKTSKVMTRAALKMWFTKVVEG